MHGNISNGGLVAKFGNKELISDFNKLWFLNADDEFVYYSDGGNGHYLCRLNENDPEGSVILKRPCANVALGGDWLYYIDESDRRVYRCLRGGRSESLILREEVSAFVLTGKNELVYAAKTGSLKTLNGTLAENAYPANLCAADGKAFYSAVSDNYFLNCVDIGRKSGCRGRRLCDIIPSFINSDGRHIYFTDAKKGNAIYRLSAGGGSPVKICGESAGYLHIIGDELFFWNGFVWKRISLEGGNAKEVR